MRRKQKEKVNRSNKMNRYCDIRKSKRELIYKKRKLYQPIAKLYIRSHAHEWFRVDRDLFTAFISPCGTLIPTPKPCP